MRGSGKRALIAEAGAFAEEAQTARGMERGELIEGSRRNSLESTRTGNRKHVSFKGQGLM